MVAIEKLVEADIVSDHADGRGHSIIQGLVFSAVHVGPSNKKLLQAHVIKLWPLHRHFDSPRHVTGRNLISHRCQNFRSPRNASDTIVNAHSHVHGVSGLSDGLQPDKKEEQYAEVKEFHDFHSLLFKNPSSQLSVDEGLVNFP
jgi:hypothetical protein